MECRLQDRVRTLVMELAREHQQELAAAGRLADLEELTCQIGDEVTRQLTEQEVVRRGSELMDQPAECPDCGRAGLPRVEPEPVVLAGRNRELDRARAPGFELRLSGALDLGEAIAELGDPFMRLPLDLGLDALHEADDLLQDLRTPLGGQCGRVESRG